MLRLPEGRFLGDRGFHLGALRTAQTLVDSWGRLHISKADAASPYLKREDWVHNGRPLVRLLSMVDEGHHVSVPGGS